MAARGREVPAYTTRAYEFFGPDPGAAEVHAAGDVSIVGVGIDDPLNVGSLYRLLGCFGGGSFLHVHVTRGRAPPRDDGDAATPRFWLRPEIVAKIRTTAVGTFDAFGGCVHSVNGPRSHQRPLNILVHTICAVGS